jgi:hypothetical protein
VTKRKRLAEERKEEGEWMAVMDGNVDAHSFHFTF